MAKIVYIFRAPPNGYVLSIKLQSGRTPANHQCRRWVIFDRLTASEARPLFLQSLPKWCAANVTRRGHRVASHWRSVDGDSVRRPIGPVDQGDPVAPARRWLKRARARGGVWLGVAFADRGARGVLERPRYRRFVVLGELAKLGDVAHCHICSAHGDPD